MGAIAVAVLIAALSAVLPDEPAPVDLIADLDHAGTTSIVFERPLGETTSPACGCLRHDPPGGWQGVVVPGRELIVERVGGSGPTQFDVYNPEPAQWNYFPSHRGVITDTAFIDGQITTNTLLQALSNRAFALDPTPTDLLSIVTSGPLHIASIGDAPVAALGTPDSGTVEISADGRSHGELRVTAPFVPGDDESEDETNAIPILDIVGSHVLLWARADVERTMYESLMTDPPKPYHEDAVETTRRTATETYRHDRPRGARYVVAMIARGSFATRIVPRPGNERTTTTGEPIRDGAGRVRVTVPRATRDGASLARALRRIEAEPNVMVDGIPFMTDSRMVTERTSDLLTTSLWYENAQEFEYPPIPPVSGVNVFGELDLLRFDQARGDLTAGKDPIELGARTPLELRGFTGREDNRDRFLIPIRMDDRSAKLRLVTRSDARLNGEPLKRERHVVVEAVSQNSVAFIATVAAAFLAGAGLLRRRRSGQP